MFFGWGRRSKQWPVGSDLLVCSYRYVHLWWVLRLAFGETWFLVTDQRSQDRQLSAEQAERLLPAGTVALSLWERYGLLLAAGALALVVVVKGLLSSPG